MSNADEYDYRVRWSKEDGAYVGMVAEFPSLIAHGGTAGAALAGIRDLVCVAVGDLEEQGDHPAPVPGCREWVHTESLESLATKPAALQILDLAERGAISIGRAAECLRLSGGRMRELMWVLRRQGVVR